MNNNVKELLESQLVKHEEFRIKPYRDTEGKLTIGVGRNLDDVGINYGEGLLMLENDIKNIEKTPYKIFPNFDSLSTNRQVVIYNMIFNLGEPRFKGFTKMIDAINAGDFELAAKEMLDSRWATQVKGRAQELSQLMQQG